MAVYYAMNKTLERRLVLILLVSLVAAVVVFLPFTGWMLYEVYDGDLDDDDQDQLRDDFDAQKTQIDSLTGQIQQLQTQVTQLLNSQNAPLGEDQEEEEVNWIFRSMSGFGYNEENWGGAGTPFTRLAQPSEWQMLESVSTVNARHVSLAMSDQTCCFRRTRCNITMLWVIMGQLIDHDITLSTGCGRSLPQIEIDVSNDPVFGTGAANDSTFIRLDRRAAFFDAHGDPQFNNAITAWLDGSFLYGSDDVRATNLRTFKGGQLRVFPQSHGDLLPVNVVDEEAEMSDFQNSACRLVCGDERCEEQAALVVWHTVWLRYHNTVARQVERDHPEYTEDQMFHYTRHIVVSVFARMVYEEWLPIIFEGDNTPAGQDPLGPLAEFAEPTAPPMNLHFAFAAFRFGHTLVDNVLWMAEQDDTGIARTQEVDLMETFFNTSHVVRHNIDPFLRGMLIQPARRFDSCVIPNLQHHLFANVQTAFMDLLAINIARGRETEIPTFNMVRRYLSLPPIATFAQLVGNHDPPFSARLVANLTRVYGTSSTENLDLFVGMLSEQPTPGTCFPPTFREMLRMQFRMLRDQDPYFYAREGVLDEYQQQVVQSTRLADVLQQVADVALPSSLGDDARLGDVFRLASEDGLFSF